MFKNRKSIRLKNYNYSQPGAYYVTVCAQNRKYLFGEIYDGKMVLNKYGEIVDQCWNEIPKHFPHVNLDEYVIMANHIHGIINITGYVGANNYSPLQILLSSRPHGTSKTIGSIIRGFKIGVTKSFCQNTNIKRIWQRNYYEHTIRNEFVLNRIRYYILNNPANWKNDKYYAK